MPKTQVTPKFLNRLADSIYNPVTRRFLRLCDGTLQNGPDPKTGKPMHCGLGELYFAMTGHQPEADGVSESDVVDKACELAGFEDIDTQRHRAEKAIKAMSGISENARDELLNHLDNIDEEDLRSETEVRFREVLDAIPDKNDGGDVCGTVYEEYRSRSCRVATQLRRAAKVLAKG